MSSVAQEQPIFDSEVNLDANGIKAQMRDQIAEESPAFESQSEIEQQLDTVKSLTIDTSAAAEVDEWNVIDRQQKGPQLADSDSDDDDASIPDETEGASEQDQNSSGIFQTMSQRNSRPSQI